MKKIFLVIVLIMFGFFLIRNQQLIAKATSSTIQDKMPKLTQKQKDLIQKKREELQKKYFSDLKEKSIEEKKAAYEKYKAELKEYCEKELGIKCPYETYKHHRIPIKKFFLE